jgi:signal transduction histidine kinase
VASTLLAVPRALRDDLWTTARDPLPKPARPRWLARLPHVLIVVLAALVAVINVDEFYFGWGLGWTSLLTLALIQSGAMVAAMFRPVPAWWVVTVAMMFGALAAAARTMEALRLPGGVPGPSPHPLVTTPLPWSNGGIIAQALVLLLLALRVRPRAALAALAISFLAGLACLSYADPRHEDNLGPTTLVLTAVTVIGVALRGRRVARTQLIEQEVVAGEERARRTLLEERNRIARELHDVVAHHMSVVSIQAQVARHLVENPSDELKENLAGIRENAVEALTELRRVLGVLRSEDPLPDGARYAPQPTLDRLDELVGNVRGAGLAVTVETTGEPRPLPPGVELSAFRIVQEALSNVLRHAPSARARVEIGYRPDGLTLRVANTAPDRPAPPARGPGHGLLGMRERVAMLGGELAAGPVPGSGYEVTAVLPAEPVGGVS